MQPTLSFLLYLLCKLPGAKLPNLSRSLYENVRFANTGLGFHSVTNQESGHSVLQNFEKSDTKPLSLVPTKIITPQLSNSLDSIIYSDAKQKKARVDCNSVPLFSTTLRRMCYNMQKKAGTGCSLVSIFNPAQRKMCYRNSKQKKAGIGSLVPPFSPTLKRLCYNNTKQKKAGTDCSSVPLFNPTLRRLCLSAVGNQNGQWARHRQRRMQNNEK